MSSPVPKGNLCLVIPAYKPPRELVGLLTQVVSMDRAGLIRNIVVFDDGSGSEFADVFDALAPMDRITLLRHAVNLGKGAALKTGINFAMVTWADTDGVVTADADGQHAPGDVVKVAEMLSLHPGDMVLWVRHFNRRVPLRSWLGNHLTGLVFRILTGVRVCDTQTGLRGLPRHHCLEALTVPADGYDFEMECLVRFNRGGNRPLPFLQARIETIYHNGNTLSHFTPLLDSMRIYFVFVRYCGSGLLAAALDYATFSAVFTTTSNLAVSQVAGRCVAVCLAFVLARQIVFHSTAPVAGSLVKYLSLVAAMGFVSYSLIQFLHSTAGLGIVFAKFLAEGLLFLGNFAIQRDFIFIRR